MLPTDSKARKEIPLFDFYKGYFPRTMVALTKLSKRANDKHNPGQPMHWSRHKSSDHPNCLLRHMLEMDGNSIDPETGELFEVAVAWRACAIAELALEAREGIQKAAEEKQTYFQRDNPLAVADAVARREAHHQGPFKAGREGADAVIPPWVEDPGEKGFYRRRPGD